MCKDIAIENLTVRLNEATIIDNLSLKLSGRSVCLFGKSGCGKTTLLNVLAGLVKPEHGHVSGMPAKVAYLFQEDRLLPWVSAVENVNCVLGEGNKALAEEWLLKVGLLPGDIGKLPRQLSGGMKRRVALARALAFGGDILLIDEPFRGQDEKRRQELMEVLRQHTAGRRMIMVTHDMEEAKRLCDNIVQFEGPPLEVIG